MATVARGAALASTSSLAAHGAVTRRSRVPVVAPPRDARGEGCRHTTLRCGASGRRGGRAPSVVHTSASVPDWGHGASAKALHQEEAAVFQGIFDLEGRGAATLNANSGEREDANAKTLAVQAMITTCPDAYTLCSIAETHWRDFDATATVRALAWLAKFKSLEASAAGGEGASALPREAEGATRLKSLVAKFANDFSTKDLVLLLGGFAQLGWAITPALSDRSRSLAVSSNLDKLSCQEVVCCVWALGKISANALKPSKRVLKSLEECCLSHCTSANGIETSQLVQMVWGFGQLGHRLPADTWFEALKASTSQLDDVKSLQPSEQALFAWSLSRVGLTSDRQVGKGLLRAFKATVKQYDLLSMNTMLKCFHLMKVKVPQDLLAKCEVRCLQCMSKCETGAISDFIYRCVKTRHAVNVHTRVYVENLVNSKMDELNAKDMALLMWSFAKLGHKPKATFLKRLEHRFEMLEMKPQSLSLLIWAYAKLRLPVHPRFSEAHYYMVWKELDGMNMQCLANIMWSYGRLGLDVPVDLFQQMADHFRMHLRECNAQNVSNIMVSMARMGHRPDRELLSLVEVHLASEQVISKFSCQGLSNVLWSLIKLKRHPGEHFMLSFQKQFGAQVGKASPQNIANVVWSFAQMRYSPYESVMESLFETVAQKVDTFSEQDVATLLWGCGKLRYKISDRLLEKFQAYCLKRARHFSLHDISLTLWGFTQQQMEVRPEVLQQMYEMSIKHLDKEFHTEAFVHVVWSLSVRNKVGLNRGAVLVERYEQEILESVHTLSGYDASKLFCSLSFLDCMTAGLCEKLVKIIEARAHSYDESQLQSILNAADALDVDLCPPTLRDTLKMQLDATAA